MSAEPKKSVCRGCGKMIVWGTEEKTGKRIPLDPTPPVYEVQGFFDYGTTGENRDIHVTTVQRNFKAYVSHFATCPDADRFSGKRKTEISGLGQSHVVLNEGLRDH